MSNDLFNFDLFNFEDDGPSPEEIAAEEERQEIMWTSYVNEMLTVLKEYVHLSDEEYENSSSTQASFTLTELLSTVKEILSEHVGTRASERDTSSDTSSTNSGVEDSCDKNNDTEELPSYIASLHSALPLFALALSGPAKCVYLPALEDTASLTSSVEVLSSKAWVDDSKAEVTDGTEDTASGVESEAPRESEVSEVNEADGTDGTDGTDRDVDDEKTVVTKGAEVVDGKTAETVGETTNCGTVQSSVRNEVEEETESKEDHEDSDMDDDSLYELPAKPILLPLRLGTDIRSYRNPDSLKPRCGLMKVKIAQLLQMLICCRYEAIDLVVAELGLLSRLWDLFFLHEGNNTLHCAVTNATIDILEGTSVALKYALLNDSDGCNLVTRILDSFELNETRLANGDSRLCYMGQLSMCAFELVRSTDPIVCETLSKAEDRWEQFQVQTLEALADLDQKQLGDPIPEPVVSEAQDHQMLLENLTAILSSLRLSGSN
jgi:hypothetical protein